MSNKKLKEKKKKNREREAKQVVARRREHIQKKRQEEKKAVSLDRKFKIKQQPILKPETIERQNREFAESRKEANVNKLKHNIELLKRLEASFAAEKKNREELNNKLEDNGHFTFKEKMDSVLKEKLEILQEKSLD